MLKYLLSLLSVCVVAASCLKSESSRTCPYSPSTITVPEQEQQALATYLDTNNIEAVKHPSGFYYQLSAPGTGTDSIGLCSQIQINYRGTLVTGAQFDKQDNVVFVLGSLIEGWRKAIPMLRKGGQFKLFIPPTLGYGNVDKKDQQGQIVIPKNSILIFEVKLLDYTAAN